MTAASAPSGEALRVVEGAREGREIPIYDELLLGRSAPPEGRLDADPAVSRRHARIARTAGGGLLISDVGSSNGTWVNGERVSSSDLAPGDRIRLGDTVLEVVRTMVPARPTEIRKVPEVREPDWEAFRAEFPVFRNLLYLNAGTDGPVPQRAADAAGEQIALEVARGRSSDDYWGELIDSWSELRARYAGWLGCDPDEVALTRAATDGVNTVLAGLDLRRGDEIVTSDEEHPGLLGPLAAVRERYGVVLRVAPFDEVAAAATPRTRLIACSHVSWRTGKLVDADALRATGVPVLLDGAQALGAIPVEVERIGCDFYAAAGQKWLCGPDRTGCLFIRAGRIEDLSPPVWPNYMSLADPGRPLDLVLHAGARRFDPGVLPGVLTRWALTSIDVLEERGRRFIVERGPALAERLASMLAEAGVQVSPRGRSTLVSFAVDDAAATAEAWARDGVVVRDIPGTGRLRASIGAWCLEDDLERVVRLATR